MVRIVRIMSHRAFGLLLAGFLLTGGGPVEAASSIVYSTYLGGSGWEGCVGIAPDSTGSAWVACETSSDIWPSIGLGPISGSDVVLLKLGPDGALESARYLEGFDVDDLGGMVRDGAGNIYLAGRTQSPGFPRVNPVQATPPGPMPDAFVAKLDPTGSTLLFSTNLGGSAWEEYVSLAVDAEGYIYLAGSTSSPDFPTHHPIDATFGGGTRDAFVAKLDPFEPAIVYATYLGGSDDESAYSVAVDAWGNALVAGGTRSADFPTVNAVQAQLRGHADGFAAKLSPSGSSLVYSTYLGGSSGDFLVGVVAGPAGDAYVTGSTDSSDFPVHNALQPALASVGFSSDSVVSRLSPAGSILYSTYLGGSGDDRATSIALDRQGAIYVAGTTSSADFPVEDPVQAECAPVLNELYCEGGDAYLAKLAPSGSSLVFSTFLGGAERGVSFSNQFDGASQVAVDFRGGVYLAGFSYSSDFPAVSAVQPASGGSIDGFAAKIDLNQPPDCATPTARPSVLWPPNGRMVPVSILGVTDPDGDPIRLEITGITHDEPGAGIAFSGIGSSLARVKAERDGKGDGRVYHILFEASDPSGASCTGEVTVCVPHDKGDGICVDGGATADR